MRFLSSSSSSRPTSTKSNDSIGVADGKQSLDDPPRMIDLAKWVDTTVTAMNGKVFDSSPELIPVDQAKEFPVQDCFCLLDGDQLNIPHDIDGDVKIVMFSFRHYGFALLRSWMDALDAEILSNTNQTVGDESATLSSQIKMVEICYIETGILSMAKNMMAKSMRNKIESNRLSNSYLKFGGIMELAVRLSLPNIFTGYIFVLDRFNRIRWKACGEPTEDEIKTAISVIRNLTTLK
jgi:ATPase complex subunit ATP10